MLIDPGSALLTFEEGDVLLEAGATNDYLWRIKSGLALVVREVLLLVTLCIPSGHLADIRPTESIMLLERWVQGQSLARSQCLRASMTLV